MKINRNRKRIKTKSNRNRIDVLKTDRPLFCRRSRPPGRSLLRVHRTGQDGLPPEVARLRCREHRDGVHDLRGVDSLCRNQGRDRVRYVARSAQGRSGHVAQGGHERVAAAAADSRFAVDPQAPGPGWSPEESGVDSECDQVSSALQAGSTGVGSARVSRARGPRSRNVLKQVLSNRMTAEPDAERKIYCGTG